MTCSNPQRSRDAEVALATFSALTGEEGRHAVIDLLVNLGHLCDRDGLDYLQLIVTAVGHWKVEQTYPNDPDRDPPLVTLTIGNESQSHD
jgi:hypothetical protein